MRIFLLGLTDSEEKLSLLFVFYDYSLSLNWSCLNSLEDLSSFILALNSELSRWICDFFA